MPRKKLEERKGVPPSTSSAMELEALVRSEGNVDAWALDARVLYLAVVYAAAGGASITIGKTKDGSAWVCQLWDGDYPVKDYFRETALLNKHLAAVAKVYGKKGLSDTEEQVIREYGW